MYYFFTFAKKIVDEEKLPLYVSLGILNNDYPKFIKQFVRMALKKTGRKFKLKQIKTRIHENVLLRQIQQIEKKILVKIQKDIYVQFDEMMEIPSRAIDWDFIQTSRKTITFLHDVIEKMNPKMLQKMIDEIFQKFSKIFHDYCFKICPYIKISNQEFILDNLEFTVEDMRKMQK